MAMPPRESTHSAQVKDSVVVKSSLHTEQSVKQDAADESSSDNEEMEHLTLSVAQAWTAIGYRYVIGGEKQDTNLMAHAGKTIVVQNGGPKMKTHMDPRSPLGSNLVIPSAPRGKHLRCNKPGPRDL